MKLVEFVLFGQPFVAMSAGPLDPFNHAISFVVNCSDQGEIDRYWNALVRGGSAERCGWLKDRFGLSWQIVPTVLSTMMGDTDRAKARRARCQPGASGASSGTHSAARRSALVKSAFCSGSLRRRGSRPNAIERNRSCLHQEPLACF